MASPAFKVKLYVRSRGRALDAEAARQLFVNSYVKPQWLTHDPARVESYRTDPLITRPISVRVLGLYAADRIVADAQAISVPVQLLVSGSDFVVHRGPQDRFYERLSSPIERCTCRASSTTRWASAIGHRHWRASAASSRRVSPNAARAVRRDAHRHGPTFEESEILAWPPERNSLADLRWRVVRGGLRLAARCPKASRWACRPVSIPVARWTTSTGMRRAATHWGGWSTATTWMRSAGVASRRGQHLQELLRDAAQRLRGQGTPVLVLDGRRPCYVLEALGQGERADRIVLRDFSDLNVPQGQALIQRLGAADIARFEQGDAFDPAQLAKVDPAPTLAVVSGLYELFPDNDAVLRSLQGIAAAVPVATGLYPAPGTRSWNSLPVP